MRSLRRCAAFSVMLLPLGLGCESTTRPGFVASLRLTPDSAHVEPGDLVEFEAVPISESGDPLPDRVRYVRWAIEGPDVADLDVVDDRGRVTARTPGHAAVEVELGRGSGRADIWVRPPGLASIAIEPSPVELERLERVSFRAVLLDDQGVEFDPGGFRISWGVDDDDIALVSVLEGPTSSAFGRAVGTTRLTLVVNGRRTEAEVIVRE